jgi:hypothetical protein
MSTQHVYESAIIDLPVEDVWKVIRPLDFSFNPDVVSAKTEGKDGPTDVGSVRNVIYKDKTSQMIKLVELSDGNRRVSWDLISSSPPNHVMSASYTVQLRKVSASNSTYISWSVDFSNDSTAEVYSDAVYKAKDNFKHLKKVVKTNLIAEFKDNKGPPELLRKLSDRSATLKKVFEEYDTNKSGRLEFDEFKLLINKLNPFGTGHPLPDMALRVLLAEADPSEEGGVNYENFVKFLDVQAKQQS